MTTSDWITLACVALLTVITLLTSAWGIYWWRVANGYEDREDRHG